MTTVYVILFDDDRIKVGTTKNFKQRMSAYRQEVKRNGIRYATAFGCVPFIDRNHALRLERHLCNELKQERINGQREWFSGSVETFKQVMDVIQQARLDFASETENKEAIHWGGVSCLMKG